MARTADNLIRSSEVASNRKAAPKVLDHIRVHPSMGGGVRVEHHYTSFEHAPKTHNFEPQDAEKFHAHMSEHTGLSYSTGAQDENEIEKAGT